MKELPLTKQQLQYNERNLKKSIEFTNTLTGAQKEELAHRIRLEKESYQEMANRRFDSSKNWSTMIKPECNDERNRIMSRLKFNQLKKIKLHEFVRKQRQDIIEDGKRKEIEQAASDDFSSIGRPSTAATTAYG